jgi:glycosyltransferase involved in cell wall biosynthesis
VGWITQRTDLELLRFVAEKRPQYDLHIAGPLEYAVDLGKTGLVGMPNVTISGELPYRDVPRFLESLDVCLIPHKDTEYSRAMSPMKLFQYLGSGRPVVATRVEGVDRWKETVSIASTPEEFTGMIDGAISGDTIEDSRRRIECVRKETWEARIDGMLEAVEEKILGKKGSWT